MFPGYEVGIVPRHDPRGALAWFIDARELEPWQRPIVLSPPGRGRQRAADDEVRQPSGLRDHEHDGHDGKRDAADGEQPDGAELQRYVAAGSQGVLQLALALCSDDQQPDRE